jgi:hypothetical protein
LILGAFLFHKNSAFHSNLLRYACAASSIFPFYLFLFTYFAGAIRVGADFRFEIGIAARLKRLSAVSV